MNTLPNHALHAVPLFAITTCCRRQWLRRGAGIRMAGVICLLSSTLARGDERTVSFPDGTPKLVYSVDEEGRRHGGFRENFLNGKTKTRASFQHDQLHGSAKVYHENGRLRVQANYVEGKLHGPYSERSETGQLIKQSSYRSGLLHGPRRRFEKGKLVRDEYWLDGTLLIPRMPAIIQQQLAVIRQARVATVGEIPQLPPPAVAAVRSPKEQQLRENAVRALMSYRFLCGVPYDDLQVDRTYTAYNVVTCALLNDVDQMTHSPPNPGWPTAQYEFGKKGAGRSNLYTAWSHGSTAPPSMVDAMHSWMEDSDESNISRLGHRRWCLNPRMLKLGIASSGRFCAMWAFDESREKSPDFDHVAFPPSGLLPTQTFESSYAWHVSLNPNKYGRPQKDAVKVRIVQARVDLKGGNMTRSAQALPLDYFHVDVNGFGIPNAIIFRPKDLELTAGSHFWVEIIGLVDAQGQPTQVQYLAGFF